MQISSSLRRVNRSFFSITHTHLLRYLSLFPFPKKREIHKGAMGIEPNSFRHWTPMNLIILKRRSSGGGALLGLSTLKTNSISILWSSKLSKKWIDQLTTLLIHYNDIWEILLFNHEECIWRRHSLDLVRVPRRIVSFLMKYLSSPYPANDALLIYEIDPSPALSEVPSINS